MIRDQEDLQIASTENTPQTLKGRYAGKPRPQGPSPFFSFSVFFEKFFSPKKRCIHLRQIEEMEHVQAGPSRAPLENTTNISKVLIRDDSDVHGEHWDWFGGSVTEVSERQMISVNWRSEESNAST